MKKFLVLPTLVLSLGFLAFSLYFAYGKYSSGENRKSDYLSLDPATNAVETQIKAIYAGSVLNKEENTLEISLFGTEEDPDSKEVRSIEIGSDASVILVNCIDECGNIQSSGIDINADTFAGEITRAQADKILPGDNVFWEVFYKFNKETGSYDAELQKILVKRAISNEE